MSEYYLENALVVGASGFVGKVLCEQLQSQGTRVKAMLRNEQAGPWDETVLSSLEESEKNAEAIFQGVNTVFYLASIAHNKAPPEMYQQINVDYCQRFARLSVAHGVKRFVYVSSTKAMAEPGKAIFDESVSTQPEDNYGRSKRQAEEALLDIEGIEHLVIARPCLVYGPGVQGNLYSMMKMIGKGVFPPLPETQSKRSMIGVADLSRALIALAGQSKCHGNVYILTDGQRYSVKQIENAIRKAMNKNIPVWNIPLWLFTLVGFCGDMVKKIIAAFPVGSDKIDKLIGPAEYSSQKITDHTGWKAEDSFYDILPSMIKAYSDK